MVYSKSLHPKQIDSCLKEIRVHSVVIATPEGDIELENDFEVAMTGYRPNFKFLETLGVTLDENQTPSYNPETMETYVNGLYLAGVVCGGMDTHKWFIENSRVHAELIMNNILGR